ncbi:MAG: HNH endonuclease signature motif containing protein [Anaeromyxobacteraceae bacterium]
MASPAAAPPTGSPRPARRPRGDDAFLARLEARAAAAKGEPSKLVLSRADGKRLVALAVKLARGHGPEDLRVGEGLWTLRPHDFKLGYNGIGDLALDRLGIDPAHARWLAGLAEKLATRPLIRAAVASGELSMRKAEAIVDAAVDEKLEAYWLGRARLEPVRELERLTKPGTNPYDEGWRDVVARLEDPVHREHVEYAFEVASVILGDPDAPKWKVIRALCMEFLGGHPVPVAPGADAGEGPSVVARPPEGPSGVARGPEEAGAPVPEATGTTGAPEAGPSGVARSPAVEPSGMARAAAARLPPPPCPSPQQLLRELARLQKARLPDEERFGRAILLVRVFRAYRLAGARTFEVFCVEQLGVAPSTARQRMTLERNLRALPELREALRTGALSYEQARAVAKVATPADVAPRIVAAAKKPAIETRREVQQELDQQMWREGTVKASVPRDVDELFAEALLSARLRSGPGLSPGQALFLMSFHFTDVWEPLALDLVLKADEIKLRDGGRCQVPGCSHPAEHVHHVRFRSQGGRTTGTNLVSVCSAHHLIGIHKGFIRVSGTAPGGLVWEFLGRDSEEIALLFPEDPAERDEGSQAGASVMEPAASPAAPARATAPWRSEDGEPLGFPTRCPSPCGSGRRARAPRRGHPSRS